MYTEDELLPISALRHLIFCERRCALVHIEQLWEENLFTAEGRVLHESVDSGQDLTRRAADCAFTRSDPALAYSMADVVEFGATRCPELLPVEYRGRKKEEIGIDAVMRSRLCLEEMLKVHVPNGAIFYGSTGGVNKSSLTHPRVRLKPRLVAARIDAWKTLPLNQRKGVHIVPWLICACRTWAGKNR